MLDRVQLADASQHQLFRGDWAAKKHLRRETNQKKLVYLKHTSITLSTFVQNCGKYELCQICFSLYSASILLLLALALLTPVLFLFTGCSSMDVLVTSSINALNGTTVKISCLFTSCYKMDPTKFAMNWTYQESLNDTEEMVKWIIFMQIGRLHLKTISLLWTLSLSLSLPS